MLISETLTGHASRPQAVSSSGLLYSTRNHVRMPHPQCPVSVAPSTASSRHRQWGTQQVARKLLCTQGLNPLLTRCAAVPDAQASQKRQSDWEDESSTHIAGAARCNSCLQVMFDALAGCHCYTSSVIAMPPLPKPFPYVPLIVKGGGGSSLSCSSLILMSLILKTLKA